jgi:hypothetical protein
MRMIWRAVIYLPFRIPLSKDVNVLRVQTSEEIIFRLTSPHYGPYLADDIDNRIYHYYCETCHCSCGNPDEVFRTSAERAKNLKDGPTGDQQSQMSSHARQHSIMWSWARSLETM